MNKQKQNTKNSKGITLVALIITIVVLLILAMVAIGAVEESNIIGHAQNAATSYNQKRTEEEEILTDAEGLLGNLVNTINNENKIPTTPPTPPATTEIRYYKVSNLINKLTITGNNGTSTVYKIDENGAELLNPSTPFVRKGVENPVTIVTTEGISVDITTEDMQVEIPETIAGYIKGNYLYGLGEGEKFQMFELVTNSAEIADIEGKIANLNSSADVENIVVQ